MNPICQCWKLAKTAYTFGAKEGSKGKGLILGLVRVNKKYDLIPIRGKEKKKKSLKKDSYKNNPTSKNVVEVSNAIFIGVTSKAPPLKG